MFHINAHHIAYPFICLSLGINKKGPPLRIHRENRIFDGQSISGQTIDLPISYLYLIAEGQYWPAPWRMRYILTEGIIPGRQKILTIRVRERRQIRYCTCKQDARFRYNVPVQNKARSATRIDRAITDIPLSCRS